MFDHTSCTKCSALRAEAVRLTSGPQSVGIGQASPETLRAGELVSEMYRHESEAYRAYAAEEDRLQAIREAQLRAEGYIELWDSSEREYYWVKAVAA